MAEVWLARLSGESGFRKTFVLKILLPHLAEDAACVRMFISEALLGSVLDHPNIVPIFDHGKARESYFIAMEFVSGHTLRSIERSVKKAGGKLPFWLVARTVVAVCDALEYAYSLKDENGVPMMIVHRDITPENVMISFKGVTKVLDFGIAKISTAAIKTEVGVIKGKLAYLAPEQIIGTSPDADARIDLYALGVVLYELLAGIRPFQGANELALFKEIVDKEPAPPRKFEP
ncbi:MAG: serine/threonine protein kinase, partial [Deltaproteobacteria bacterium]|nr:serine/threonine protein kinase [Deltaproteobacteria bacterium]